MPCHRVIGANGSLTGFPGGVDAKAKRLLSKQNVHSRTAPGVTNLACRFPALRSTKRLPTTSGCEFTVKVPSQHIESKKPKLAVKVLIRITLPVAIAPALGPIGSHPACYPLIEPIVVTQAPLQSNDLQRVNID